MEEVPDLGADLRKDLEAQMFVLEAEQAQVADPAVRVEAQHGVRLPRGSIPQAGGGRKREPSSGKP